MRKNNKIILSSIIVMCFVAPAMATPSHTGEFPSGGLMQADYTYTGAATADNMAGVTEGSVNAIAQYEDIQYTVGAGKYLPAGGEAVIDCNVANSFCPGLSGTVTYDADNAQGLTSCSSATNGEYTLSDGTGSASTSCYRTCTTSDVAHSTAVTGMRYYNGTDGDGVNACEPASANGCVTGYHYVAAVAGAGVDLATEMGVTHAASGYGYISNDPENTSNASAYGLSQNGTFVVDYGNGKKISGKSGCSTRSATDPWVGTNWAYVLQSDGTTSDLPNASGQYCYCQLDGYTTNGDNWGNMTALSALWVYLRDLGDGGADVCAYYCGYYCAYFLDNSSTVAFRAAVFGTVPAGHPASCAANTITINWTGASVADIEANEAGTATYDGDIRTPRAAEQQTGKTFKGWRFSAPQNNNNSGNNNG